MIRINHFFLSVTPKNEHEIDDTHDNILNGFKEIIRISHWLVTVKIIPHFMVLIFVYSS